MADNNLTVITGENFDMILQSSRVVLIDFWAEWCNPCRMFLPIVAELAEEYKGKAIIGKVNVDEEGELAEKFGIMSIPTIFIYKDGNLVEKLVGSRPKPLLKTILDKYVEV